MGSEGVAFNFSEDRSTSQSDGGGNSNAVGGGEILSNHVSVWHAPFDLDTLPAGVKDEVVRNCPFVLGDNIARYSLDFFRTTGALCDKGFMFKQLKDDALFLVATVAATFSPNKKGNRHPLKLITDREAARLALHMYQRVYGGTQPDNGEFAACFIRGLALYYQRSKNVNWAAHARSLARTHAKNPGRNPQKLTPPCFREQIQKLIHIFGDALHAARTSHRRRRNATPSGATRRPSASTPVSELLQCARTIPLPSAEAMPFQTARS